MYIYWIRREEGNIRLVHVLLYSLFPNIVGVSKLQSEDMVRGNVD